jgi:hypothetical protein
MQHRNIPYEYNEWTTYNGKPASGYSCEAFSEFPYYITYLSAQTEDGIKERIDYFLDNRAAYEYRRKLSDAGNQAYYNEKSKTPGAYTGD